MQGQNLNGDALMGADENVSPDGARLGRPENEAPENPDSTGEVEYFDPTELVRQFAGCSPLEAQTPRGQMIENMAHKAPSLQAVKELMDSLIPYAAIPETPPTQKGKTGFHMSARKKMK